MLFVIVNVSLHVQTSKYHQNKIDWDKLPKHVMEYTNLIKKIIFVKQMLS